MTFRVVVLQKVYSKNVSEFFRYVNIMFFFFSQARFGEPDLFPFLVLNTGINLNSDRSIDRLLVGLPVYVWTPL